MSCLLDQDADLICCFFARSFVRPDLLPLHRSLLPRGAPLLVIFILSVVLLHPVLLRSSVSSCCCRCLSIRRTAVVLPFQDNKKLAHELLKEFQRGRTQRCIVLRYLFLFFYFVLSPVLSLSSCRPSPLSVRLVPLARRLCCRC